MDAVHRTKEEAKKILKDFIENDPKAQATELGKNLAGEMTIFIKNNPWAAVAGAAVIGYLIGTMRGGRK